MGCARMSLLLAGSAPQGYKNIPYGPNRHYWASSKGLLECTRRFSFVEMKGGLAQVRSNNWKKGRTEGGTYKKRIRSRYTGPPPERVLVLVLAQVESTQHHFEEAR